MMLKVVAIGLSGATGGRNKMGVLGGTEALGRNGSGEFDS